MSQSQRFNQGKEKQENGDLHGAILDFEAEIAENPQNPTAYSSLGEIYAQLGKWEKAKSCYSKLILFEPSDRNYFLLGESLYQSGHSIQAVEAFRMSLRDNPNLLESHLALATLYGNSGNQYKKELYLKNALILDESNELVMEELISVYSKTFRFQEAVELCQNYLLFYPEATQIKILLIELLMRMEKFNSSFEYLSICMNEDPNVHKAILASDPAKKDTIRKLLKKKKKRLLNSLADHPDPRLAVDLSILFLLYGDIYHSAKYLVYARQLKERIQMASSN